MKNTPGEKQKSFDTHHAVVIGGSMAGLLAARVLSEHFERVTIIERNQLLDDVQPRKGVPQGRHVHTLLAGGAAILGEYFPDLFAALARDGAASVIPSEVRRYQFGVRVAPVPSPARSLWQSRPFLEWHVRTALLERPNVRILDGCSVTRLMVHDERITSVVLRHCSGHQREDELAADLVVDASGRGSHASQWLVSLGYGQVEETCVTIDVGYASRVYCCPDQLPGDWKVLVILGTPPDNKRVGVIFPMEGGHWMVTLGGWLRDYSLADDTDFLEYAHSLAQSDLYEAIKQAEPITGIVTYKCSANQWRRYEHLLSLPEGFIAMSDFNPVFGQGMSVAAIEARTLDTCLREQQGSARNARPASFPQRFQKAIAREIKMPGCCPQDTTCAIQEPKGIGRWTYVCSTGTSIA